MSNTGAVMALMLSGNFDAAAAMQEQMGRAMDDKAYAEWAGKRATEGSSQIMAAAGLARMTAAGLALTESYTEGLNKANVTNDFRGSKIYQQVRVTTNDPSRITEASMRKAGEAFIKAPRSGRIGMGGAGMATGR